MPGTIFFKFFFRNVISGHSSTIYHNFRLLSSIIRFWQHDKEKKIIFSKSANFCLTAGSEKCPSPPNYWPIWSNKVLKWVKQYFEHWASKLDQSDEQFLFSGTKYLGGGYGFYPPVVHQGLTALLVSIYFWSPDA